MIKSHNFVSDPTKNRAFSKLKKKKNHDFAEIVNFGNLKTKQKSIRFWEARRAGNRVQVDVRRPLHMNNILILRCRTTALHSHKRIMKCMAKFW